MVVDADPYAFVTVALNQDQLKADTAEMRMKYVCKRLALELDQHYLKTRNVTRRKSSERFNAIGFFEKLIGYPHVHMAFFADGRATQIERSCRCRFLLRNLVTDPKSLSHEDVVKNFSHEVDVLNCSHNNILHKIHRSLTANVRSVYFRHGLAKYITKEYNISESEYFLLGEFHSSKTPRDWRVSIHN